MTLNDRHIKNRASTPSPAQTALKKVAKVVVVILGAIVGLMIWAVVKAENLRCGVAFNLPY